MINRRFLFILALIFTVVVSLSAVSAANDDIVVGDAVVGDAVVGDVDVNGVDVGVDNYPLHKEGTFSQLQELINNHNSSNPLYLTKSYKYNDMVDKDLKEGIKINSSIVIIGNDYVSISGNEKARIFDISGDNVTLSNIIFKDGNIVNSLVSNKGGAISSTLSTSLTIDKCIFIDNYAYSYGGAVYFDNRDDGSIIISNSYFYNNKDGIDGGALFLAAYLVNVTDCQFIGNTVEGLGNKSHHAGAGYLHSDNLVIVEDSSFVKNYATEKGGALYVDGKGYFTINNCNFTGNLAIEGSAILFLEGSPYVTNCIFKDNYASEDGAIYSLADTLTVDNCKFIKNNAYIFGGAICTRNADSEVLIKNSEFISNNAGIGGGALFLNASCPSIDNCTFEFNTVLGRDNSHHAGAVYVFSFLASIKDSTFKYNYASDNGGALYIDSDYSLVYNTKFICNKASEVGGAVLLLKGTNIFSNCSFIGNKASRNGGAVYAYNGSSAFLSCDFSLNSAINGSAIFAGLYSDDYDISCYNDSEFELLIGGCTFSNNKASSLGTVWSKTNTNIIEESSFKNNYANVYGGAVYINNYFDNSSTIISDSEFIYNNAGIDGGALFLNDSSSSINNCNFSDNSVKGRNNSHHAGAVYVLSDVTSIDNCTFKDNYAVDNGGGLYLDTEYSNVTNSRFINNKANESGGAVLVLRGIADFYNCSFIGNNASKSGGAVYLYSGSAEFVDCDFSLNSANKGSAILAGSDSDELSIVGSTFSYNYASNSGTIWSKAKDTSVTGSSLTNNVGNESAGIYSNSKLSIDTTRFVNNDANYADDINVDGGEATIKYCWFGENIEDASSLDGRVMNSTPITIADHAYLTVTFFCKEGESEDMDVRADISLNYIENDVEKKFLSPYGIDYDFYVSNAIKTLGHDEGVLVDGQLITNSMELAGDTYKGSVIVDNQEISNIIPKINTTIIATNMEITAYDTKNLVITLKDESGNSLSDRIITFTFNGKTYTKTTDENGVAKLAINSSVVKSYSVTIKYAGNWVYKAASKTVTVKVNPAYVTISDIIKASYYVKNYVAKNNKLPTTVTVGTVKCSIAQYSYLASAAIKNINAKKKVSTKIKVINVKTTNKNTKVKVKAVKKEYLNIVNSLVSKATKGTLPSYVTVNGKKVGFNSYTLGLTNILTFFNSKNRLPNYVIFY